MKKLFYFLSFFIGIALLSFSCTTTEKKEEKKEGQKEEKKWTDCQNCGMPTTDFPNWQVMLKSNSKNFAFCSPRCMFIHVADSSNKIASSIEEIEVTDYYSTQKIDGQTAFYVTGSNKTSAMGKDFIPFSTKEDAQNFMQEHNGKKIYSFGEINQEVVVLELK